MKEIVCLVMPLFASSTRTYTRKRLNYYAAGAYPLHEQSQFTLLSITVATSTLNKEILMQTVSANTKWSLPI